jgi:hypothetical protein
MKSLQLFVILLLISFILFLVYHLELIESKEGYEDQVPTCQTDSSSSSSSYGSRAPGCFATVQEDDYLHYPTHFGNDDFILKTKIVTPVCPNNPYDHMGSDIHKTQDISLNTLPPPISTKNEPAASNQSALSNNASIPVPSMPSFQDSLMNQTPPTAQKPTEPVPARTEDKSSSPETCPPCPACERCPEPTVDCKKVIKYKDQQYPVPLISDFSHFSRF